MEHNFPCNSTRLYFGLLNMSNKLGWKNPFGATNQQLAALIGCDEKTLIRCRKPLIKSGLILVKRGCKNTPNSIRLNTIHWKNSSENASEYVPINDSENASENASHHKTETKTKTTSYTCSDVQIENIFKAYPRRVGKKNALKKIKEACLEHGPDLVLEKTKAYALVRKGLPQTFTPLPSTWYNQGRFLDEPEMWTFADSQPSNAAPWSAIKQLELVEAEIKQLKERHANPQPGGGYSWQGVPERFKKLYKQLLSRRDELKPKAMGL